MANKILVIEDQSKLASLIQRGLSADGYDVRIASDGELGLDMIYHNAFDLIVLDVMLPGISGIEVCQLLRKENNPVPILMLTALSATNNVVTGLDSGADDYMVKPFKFEELKARIRTLVRRANGTNGQQNPASSTIRIMDLVLDMDARIATRGGKEIALTATEYRLLEFMMKNKNKVLTRIEILEHVWDINFNMGTNVVDVYVNYLRKKVDKGFDVKLIHTMIGVGYSIKEA
ncbi:MULTISPECIES: response regulator transcription factor [Olivibacter]|jgi:DNA-binding response OmpR family regulator|uniref:Two component transcriptional regulator, winged helix family n=3 Tax=Sphingobacteriaceae TaxID=84566 RepID=F4C4F8_SPHS2|nr:MULTISPECIES: response regulator transcription factor [Olivibacter]MCL4638164.1 response regulator transcription factor [Olivibacter sp. UJ_SKK_5.1]MDM8175709.1 response regulator transcription factor [Olivibacter sp. 47]MDX3914316.1 response regulator transcription factor [Pseudosphingobacterium sp.]QEL02444.1 response regulator transcription factor [Olivibacter sp. LS-1]